MRPPVLLRQTVKSVTADRKTCRINSKFAPPIPKNAIGTCHQAMSADNVLRPCRQVLRPCRGKNKYSCLVKRIRANGFKHQTLPLMGATRFASGIKEKTHRQAWFSAISEPLSGVWTGHFSDARRVAPIRGSVWCSSPSYVHFPPNSNKNKSSADSCERYLHYFLLWLSTLLHPKVQSADKMRQKSVWGVHEWFLGQCVHTHFMLMVSSTKRYL